MDNGVTDGATQDKPGSARGCGQNTWGRAAPLSAKNQGEVFAQECCSVAEARRRTDMLTDNMQGSECITVWVMFENIHGLFSKCFS